MDQTEYELAQFIESILGNDNKVRQENELLMNKLLLSKPNDFIQYLLNLLSSNFFIIFLKIDL